MSVEQSPQEFVTRKLNGLISLNNANPSGQLLNTMLRIINLDPPVPSQAQILHNLHSIQS